MHFKSIRWRIAVPYVVLILVTTVGLTLYVTNQLRGSRMGDLEQKMLADAQIMADAAEPRLRDEPDIEMLGGLAARWAQITDARVTIIGTDGVVLGESHHNPATMDNHLERPEVRQARAAGKGSSIRYSQTVGYRLLYTAVPILSDQGDETVGYMRAAIPLREIDAEVNDTRRMVLTGALLSALLAILVAIVVAERITRPVRRLTGVAERLAEGDLGARLLQTTEDEVGQLTRAFNYMGEQLRQQVATLAGERGRLAAVLENMGDGVVITDASGQVQLMNPAAAALLELGQQQALGFTFAQAVRHHELISLWEGCRRTGTEQVEIVEFTRQDIFLQVVVTPFEEADDRGYLVILQDLTRIRKLETVRRDFISNISHELRTPLAGLKALVETLRDGALEDRPAAERFLNRMDAEVDTLTQMVQELLQLSRVESGEAPLRLAPVRLAEIVLEPVDRLRPQAGRAGLRLDVELPDDLPEVLADGGRVRQVVTNLVHNAIKFTPEGGRITLSAWLDADEVVTAVQDTGVGIPAEDVSRIFERFYKGDRARSGGGTGLGLAIAKHIVQGHGGTIWADSVEGEGSTFYFTLPVAD
jgi:two-component system phosphate regulon sensor histidine kinase PhoR